MCNNQSPVIEASIEDSKISIELGEVSDAKSNYTNGGIGKGVLIESNNTDLSEKNMYFIQTDLNTNLIEICKIFTDNLQFTATSTDPLALEIKSKLELIKTKLQDAVKKIA